MKKFFSIFFSSLIILVLIYTSFLVSSGNYYEKPNFKKTQMGNIPFDINLKGEIVDSKEGKLKVDYINVSDRILSYESNFEVKEEAGKNKVNLDKGVFLININSINKNYFFQGEGFDLETKGPTSFFVDNTESRVKILSIDNILKLKFLNVKSKEVINTAYLYPNQYIFFDPLKNFLIRNADLFRISQLLSLGYFNESIIKDGKVNKDFKKIFLGKDEKISAEKEKMFLYLYYDNLQKKKELEEFKEKTFFKLPGEDLMLEYNYLLLNKEKKTIYLKNELLKEIQDIFKNRDFSVQNSNSLKENLEKLRNLSSSDYAEIIQIIKYFYGNINITEKEDQNIKLFFGKLLDNKLEVDIDNINLKLNSTFYKFNFSTNPNFYSEMKKFLERKTKQMDKDEQNYFIFFLNKLIIININEEDINFEDTIDIFKIFTNSGIEYYSAMNVEDDTLRGKIIETGIINFNETITKILKKIGNYFFSKNSRGILEPKANRNLSGKYVSTLSGSLKDIYEKFYTKNEKFLGKGNISIKVSYSKNLKQIQKVLLALRDYQKYLVEYDNKNEILKGDEIKDESTKINKKNAEKFLSKFYQLRYDDSNIEVMGKSFCNNPENEKYKNSKADPTCYKINNIEVGNGVKVSFLLYPNDYNKITSISIGGDKNINRGSYKMDLEEDKYRSMSLIADGSGEVKPNSFEFFFVNVILNQGSNDNEKEVEIYNENNEKAQENSIIRTLKNTTLLGKRGAFSKLRNILIIEYNDIIVKETDDGNEYIIKIKDAELKYTSGENRNKSKSYSGEFNSDYKYKAGKVSAFFNPKIKIKSDKLHNNEILISGFIDINNFIKILENMFANFENFETLIDLVAQKDYSSEIKIVYFPKNNRFQVISKNIKVFTRGDEIESITIFGKKILEKNKKIDNIEELLQ